MSNPFVFFTRRSLLKVTGLALFSLTNMNRAEAAVAVKAKVLTPALATTVKIEISSVSAVRAYVEYGYSSNKSANKSAIISITKGSVKNITLTGLKPSSNVYFRLRYAVGASKNYLSLPYA